MSTQNTRVVAFLHEQYSTSGHMGCGAMEPSPWLATSGRMGCGHMGCGHMGCGAMEPSPWLAGLGTLGGRG